MVSLTHINHPYYFSVISPVQSHLDPLRKTESIIGMLAGKAAMCRRLTSMYVLRTYLKYVFSGPTSHAQHQMISHSDFHVSHVSHIPAKDRLSSLLVDIHPTCRTRKAPEGSGTGLVRRGGKGGEMWRCLKAPGRGYNPTKSVSPVLAGGGRQWQWPGHMAWAWHWHWAWACFGAFSFGRGLASAWRFWVFRLAGGLLGFELGFSFSSAVSMVCLKPAGFVKTTTKKYGEV